MSHGCSLLVSLATDPAYQLQFYIHRLLGSGKTVSTVEPLIWTESGSYCRLINEVSSCGLAYINSLLGGSTDAVPVTEMFSHLSPNRLCSEYICTRDKQKEWLSSAAIATVIQLTNKHINTVITAIIQGVFDRLWQDLVFAKSRR